MISPRRAIAITSSHGVGSTSICSLLSSRCPATLRAPRARKKCERLLLVAALGESAAISTISSAS